MASAYACAARVMKALAHPVRLQILDILCHNAECVCHLEAIVHKPQPYISQQLAVLRKEGLVRDFKEGQNVFYRVDRHEVEALLALFLDSGPATQRPAVGCACPKCARTMTAPGAGGDSAVPTA